MEDERWCPGPSKGPTRTVPLRDRGCAAVLGASGWFGGGATDSYEGNFSARAGQSEVPAGEGSVAHFMATLASRVTQEDPGNSQNCALTPDPPTAVWT